MSVVEFEITFENYDGEWSEQTETREEKVKLPGKYEVCPRCLGKGTHVNPSIDSHGITMEEWEQWDEDSQEMYLNGGYDVPCYECNGKRVIPVIDEEWIENYGSDLQKKALNSHRECQRQEAIYRGICESEMRFGC